MARNNHVLVWRMKKVKNVRLEIVKKMNLDSYGPTQTQEMVSMNSWNTVIGLDRIIF